MATISDFNLHTLNTTELAETLRGTISYGGNAFIVGLRGSGKTVISKQAIKDSGCHEAYLNISTCDRVDLGGYPMLLGEHSKDEFVKYMLPDYFRALIKADRPAVLLLDEVDKCDHTLLAPLLELTQFHTINGRPLPNLKACIMTGNKISEGSTRPSLPLLDRAEKYMVEANTTHWLQWAGREGRIHPSITAFLSDNPDDLFGNDDPGELYADCSPRGWHNYSNIINFGEKNNWNHRMLTNKASGCIGKKAGLKYAAYFDHYQVLLPIVDKIMRGENIKGFDDLEPSKRCVACMIVCNRLARLLDESKENSKASKKKGVELPPEMETVARFLRKVDPELALVSIRSQIGLDRTVELNLDQSPEFNSILSELSARMKNN